LSYKCPAELVKVAVSRAVSQAVATPVVSAAGAALRARALGATANLFSQGHYPLASTLDHPGDPGLFGPGSATWAVVSDTSVFVAGIRALLVQAAHPEVVAGVSEHSRYREDPLGRLARTAAYVTATSFGAGAEVSRAVDFVRRRHAPVRGVSHRGRPYDASDPQLAAWVHNSLVDSFLAAYRAYGAAPLGKDQADRLVAEQARLGELMGACPLPRTSDSLAEWVRSHPDLAPSPGASEAVRFLRRPPLPPAILAAYGVLFRAAAAILPPEVSRVVGVYPLPGDREVGRVAVRLLRLTLGSSPDLAIARQRMAGSSVRQAAS
jgi:uncharacterized protein (DUF2236 family)